MTPNTPWHEPQGWARLPIPTPDGEGPVPSTRSPGSEPEPSFAGLFAGRYRILHELARGGMGVVLQAWDTKLSREVAIKIPIHLQDPEACRRFLNEAKAVAKLDHPKICRILDMGEADGLPFIVLGFVRGRTLDEVMKLHPIDPVLASKIVRNIAKTLQFAHDNGISHRDLKPSNLMVGAHRDLIVMDFGLARFEDEDRKTRTGQSLGTLPYMAPEQVQGRAKEMGKGCDIYALGVIYYELLTGRRPFRGSSWELPRMIVSMEPETPSSLRGGIDPAIDAIVLRAMSKRISSRFRSMTEFAGAIEDYLRRVGTRSSDIVVPPTAPVPARPEPRPAAPANHAEFPVRLREESLGSGAARSWNHPLPLALCSVVSLVLIATGKWAAIDRPPSQPEKPEANREAPGVPKPRLAVSPGPPPAKPEEPNLDPAPIAIRRREARTEWRGTIEELRAETKPSLARFDPSPEADWLPPPHAPRRGPRPPDMGPPGTMFEETRTEGGPGSVRSALYTPDDRHFPGPPPRSSRKGPNCPIGPREGASPSWSR